MTRNIFLIIFMLLFLIIFTNYSIGVERDTIYAQETEEYSRHLTRAVRAVIDENVTYISEKDVSYLFDNEEKRNMATERFFTTLEQGFNYVYDSNLRHELKMHVPVLALIDTDGYYICYNMPYEDADGYINFKQTITPINTWSSITSDKQYVIRFFLSDFVEVTQISTGMVFTGSYKDVYRYFGQPVGLSCLNSYESFEATKTDCIIDEIQEKVELYINQYNFTVNSYSKSGIRTEYDLHYTFELPKVAYEDWCNLIDKPSSIAFLQGIQINDGNDYLNIYAMSGGKLGRHQGYYIDNTINGYIYHLSSCTLYSIDAAYISSKEKCASSGAFPCEVCNP